MKYCSLIIRISAWLVDFDDVYTQCLWRKSHVYITQVVFTSAFRPFQFRSLPNPCA